VDQIIADKNISLAITQKKELDVRYLLFSLSKDAAPSFFRLVKELPKIETSGNRQEFVSFVEKEVKNENDLLEQRKEKVIKVLKVNYNWIFYVMLAVIVFLTVKLRTLNVSKLKDVTTGDWTLGPDLDPFLFLRWSKYIVENGSLFSIDQISNC